MWGGGGKSTLFVLHRVVKQAVTSEVHVLGGVSRKVVSPCVLLALEECLRSCGLKLPPGPLTTVYRVELRGNLCYSMQYQRVKKRNSFTIAYLDQDGLNKFALINYFVFICEKVIAVIRPLIPLSVTSKQHFDLTNSVLDDIPFLTPVKKDNSVKCCFVEDFVSKCVFLEFASAQYVIQFPSSIIFD